jgi:GntR family transcriptional regulator
MPIHDADGRAEAARRFQRQRQTPDRLNNSTRRTYDLLRSILIRAERSIPLVERDLADGLSASRNTIRSVLQQLAREGYVTRETRTGTEAASLLVLPIDKLFPWQTQLLECRSLGRPPLLRDRLRLPPDWSVLMVENLMMESGVPLGIQVSYIALDDKESPDIHIDDPDIIQILEGHLGLRIRGSDATITSVAADEQTAELVGVRAGAPMICVDDVIEDEGGQPRALSHIRVRSDRVAFSAKPFRSA